MKSRFDPCAFVLARCKDQTCQYTVCGVLFGALFPLGALTVDMLVFRPDLSSAGEAFATNPIHLIVALAPLVLGIVFRIIGVAHKTLGDRMEALEAAQFRLAAAKQHLALRNDELKEAAEVAQTAVRVKSEFLAKIGHELRTPMNGVLGLAVLLSRTDLTSQQRGMLDTILTSGQSLVTTINDILDLTEIGSGRLTLDPAPFHLDDLVAVPMRLHAPAAGMKGVKLLIRIDPDLPEMAVADLPRLRQVVTNLVANAVKFTERGEIVVDLSPETTGTGRPALRIEVRDTGCGIPEDSLEAVFEQFTQVDNSSTRAYEGAGLGLTISKALVDLMDGTIGVTSTLGAGSTFRVVVPVSSPGGVTRRTRVVWPEGGRILVADPHSALRDVLCERLSAWGLRPVPAATIAEALERLDAVRAEDGGFDLILADPDLPGRGGRDGLLGHAALADTPLIFLTTPGHPSPRITSGTREPDDILTKPLGLAELAAVLCNFLGTTRNNEAPDMDETAAFTSTPPTATVVAESPSAAETGGQTRVLLVDDNRTNLHLVQMIVRTCGVPYLTASNGAEAVESFHAERPHLVFMDVSMPVMDGLEATRRIRAAERENGWTPCRIVGVTAHAMESDRIACLESGMDEHMAKPVDVVRMREVIAELKELPLNAVA
ncbi:response regulator [Palleronia aestuarii]|uniref:response regulator n=1 Tax=Palleronia aestuarii TaxID=568105 RepID=UPI0014744606|nr:response regulator [Palleronia aestuarii]